MSVLSPSPVQRLLAAGLGLALCAPAAAAPTSQKKPTATPAAAPVPASTVVGHQRTLQRRTLTLDDASVNTLPELYVAGGSATVVTFPIAIAAEGAFFGDVKNAFFPIQQTEKMLIIMPRADLAASAPLNVTLSDGTVVTFKCVSDAAKMDAQVDVLIALKKRAATDSVAALKARIGQLQGDLDTCRATAGDAGASKVAALLLGQSALGTPQTFDRRPLRRTTKDNRLLVEAREAYRMFGLTYIVLSVENRDPDRPWVLDRATVKLKGGGSTQDVPVKVHLAENPSLPPEGAELVVVAFPSAAGGRLELAVTLEEKDGGRSVTLGGLEL